MKFICFHPKIMFFRIHEQFCKFKTEASFGHFLELMHVVKGVQRYQSLEISKCPLNNFPSLSVFMGKICVQVAASALESSLLKYSAKEYFFRAALCHLCVDSLNAQHAVQRYEEQYPAFADSREAKLVKVTPLSTLLFFCLFLFFRVRLLFLSIRTRVRLSVVTKPRSKAVMKMRKY